MRGEKRDLYLVMRLIDGSYCVAHSSVTNGIPSPLVDLGDEPTIEGARLVVQVASRGVLPKRLLYRGPPGSRLVEVWG